LCAAIVLEKENAWIDRSYQGFKNEFEIQILGIGGAKKLG